MATKAKRKAPKPRKRKNTATDITTFTGLALVRAVRGGGREVVIIPSLASAKAFALDRSEMRLVRTAFAAAPTGTCNTQKQAGNIRCIRGTCTGKCHLYRAKRPIDPENPGVEDLGETGTDWKEMEAGYGYWCDCI